MASHAPLRDNTGNAGFGMMNGGLAGACYREPEFHPPPPSYPGSAGAPQMPPADSKGGYEKGASNMEMTRGEGQAPLSWEVVAHNSAWRGQQSLVYAPVTPGAPGYFVAHRGRGKLSVHRGGDESGPQLGEVSVRTTWSVKAELTFQSPSMNDGGNRPPQQQHLQSFTQKLDESGFIHKDYACRLPAVDPLGSFHWRRTKDHGRKRMRDTSRALSDDSGRDIAAFIRAGCFSGSVGTLKILRDDLSPLAVDQIVVACVAMEEVHRIINRNASIAAAASS